MENKKRDPDNNSGELDLFNTSKGGLQPEVLFNRQTGSERPREVLKFGITEAALNGETALFDVLPGIGKSRSIPKVADTMPVTILTNLTGNYDQYEDWGEKDGVEVEKLPTRELCPTLRNENPEFTDDSVAQEARAASNAGWSPTDIHREFNLPCNQWGNPCPYHERANKIDPDGLDPLVGNYVQAYNPAYIENRTVVVDEDAFNEYYETIEYPAKEAQKFIDTLDDFPLDNLRPLDKQKKLRKEVLLELESIGLEPSDHLDSVGDFNAKAPLITYAICGAEELDNGLKYTELPGNRTAVFEKLYETEGSEYDDGTPEMWLLDLPDLSVAKNIIGLDATPCHSKWEQILGEGYSYYRLFDDEGRNRYLSQNGYEFIQLNNHAWPSQGGNLKLGKYEAHLREVYQEHGEGPDLITSINAIEDLKERGLDHLWNDQMHYGKVRGRNEFEGSELLVVLGSPSRSDEFYQYLAGLFGESAKRVEDAYGTHRSFGNSVADDLLDTLRRGGVFQAAMRAGRDDDAKATVYIATGLVPDWLETRKVGKMNANGTFDACNTTRTPNQKAVIEAMQGEKEMSAGDIIEESGVKRKTVGGIRRKLQDRDLIEKVGKNKQATYSDIGLETLNIAGEVDLSPINSSIPQNPLVGNRNGIQGIGDLNNPKCLSRDPSELPPGQRYPDWMRDTMHRARQRRRKEQLKQLWRGKL